MRGVVLAGGLGKRLEPLTILTNKHLLPIYDKQMITYPIKTLVNAGVTDILLITGGDHSGDFLKLLGNGEEYKCNIRYAYQRGEGGIADALKLAEDFVQHERFITILGDNFYEDNLAIPVQNFIGQERGARILLKEMNLVDAKRFGVAKVRNGKVVNIVEKPKDPESDLVVTGCYMFDYKVWWFLQRIVPSDRGELEITDLLNLYIKSDSLEFDIINGYWSDMGTHKSLFTTSEFVFKKRL